MATQILNIKETTDRLETKLDSFIVKADETYATKKELKDIKDTEIHKWQFLEKNWFPILVLFASLVWAILSSQGIFI